MKYEGIVATHVAAVVTVEAENEEQARTLALKHASERATYDDSEVASDPTPAPGQD